ncbi:MAG TPA: TadE/TadG family type IV pilus assembly protein [Stellaceae bacterium]|nr:TadE/TadG family type IV pilus assembly protein [Stellaceae bacterium]
MRILHCASRRILATMRRGAASKDGNAAVEFAIIAPVLVGLLVPIADYGLYIYDQMQLNLAAQAGMEYAARNGWVPAGIQQAAINASPTLNLTAQNVSSSEFCGCPSGTSITVQNCNDPNTGQQAHCGNNAANPLVGTYVNVTTTFQYNTLFHYPGIPDSQTLSSGANLAFRLN